MKFKVCKPVRYDHVYDIYVKRWFGWGYLRSFSAQSTDEAITKAKAIADAYMKKPIVEFEL